MKPWRPSSGNAIIPKLPVSSYRRRVEEYQSATTSPRISELSLGLLPQRTSSSSDSVVNMLNIHPDKFESPNSGSYERFDSVLCKFAKMVIKEGRKAVEVATTVAHDSFKSDIQRLSENNKEALMEKDVRIRHLADEVEETRQRLKSVHKQLMNMSAQISHRSHFPFTSVQVFHVWLKKASGAPLSRLNARYRRPNIVSRILYRWRIASLNDSWKRRRDAALRTQADRHKSAVQSLENERDLLKAEVVSLQSQIKEEVIKRESFQTQLKRFIDGGFDDLSPPQTTRTNTPSLVSHACTLSYRPTRRSKSCKPIRLYIVIPDSVSL
jgi:hypothetical protein